MRFSFVYIEAALQPIQQVHLAPIIRQSNQFYLRYAFLGAKGCNVQPPTCNSMFELLAKGKAKGLLRYLLSAKEAFKNGKGQATSYCPDEVLHSASMSLSI